MSRRIKILYLLAFGLLLACTCSLFGAPAAPTGEAPDLLATLAALTPDQGLTPGAAAPTATSAFNFPAATSSPPAAIPTPPSGGGPGGHIVFTCQVFKVQAQNQICIMNADGSGYRRLTTDSSRQHYYPSLSPDGKSVIYAAFREENVYELYEMNLADGDTNQLTNKLGVLNAPEISPDGGKIVFMRWTVASDKYTLWYMDRNGENTNNIPQIIGWDPSWSPDGKQILFASNRDGSNQLYVVNLNGKNLHRISNLPAIRGRSDWSPDGQLIATYSGGSWAHEVYLMDADGSNLHQLTPSGGNSQGPSFSPDGQWVAFTAYFDHPNDDHGCEIYVIRIDGTDLRRLTDNDYCDYQPRWGP
jgi:tol-pal system beta propeller repeat protein TolB